MALRLSTTHTRPIWRAPEPLPAGFDGGALYAHPLIGELLYRRGLRTNDEIRDFLATRMSVAPDPHELPNLAEAIARVGQAIDRGETVGIFGDYDADGVTSTALLTIALRSALGLERVLVELPERAEGYGLNRRGIDAIAAGGASLLLVVDTGSSDQAGVDYARAKGLDVVILDHHRMQGPGPDGAITVSPQLREDSTYHELTAVGVAYLLVSALASHGYDVHDRGHDEVGFLDLVALGTVADVAPLTGPNRALVRGGLDGIRAGHRPGVRALLDASRVKQERVTATDIAFRLAPRLNAAGRMDSPRLALDLLLAERPRRVTELVQRLEELNHRRRVETERISQEALALATAQPGWPAQPVLMIAGQGWTSGVLGAVASKLVEELGRPVLLFNRINGTLHGSARSVAGLNIVDALQAVTPLLTRFGGHSMAAGLSLPAENLPALRAGLEAEIDALGLELPAPKTILLDAELQPEQIALDTARALHVLEPCGQGNATPCFLIRDAQVVQYTRMGHDQSHLKVTVRAGRAQAEAVFFGAGDRSAELLRHREIDIAGALEINRWNGRERLQILGADFRPVQP